MLPGVIEMVGSAVSTQTVVVNCTMECSAALYCILENNVERLAAISSPFGWSCGSKPHYGNHVSGVGEVGNSANASK